MSDNVNSAKLSIADFDLTKACEAGFEFEIVTGKGEKTGFFITIMGDHAPKIREWTRKQLNKLRNEEQIARRKNREVARQVESDEEFFINQTALKIMGWRGLKEEYTPENAILLCSKNAEIREQVNENAKDVANFTKS